jgi:hypothetical protein
MPALPTQLPDRQQPTWSARPPRRPPRPGSSAPAPGSRPGWRSGRRGRSAAPAAGRCPARRPPPRPAASAAPCPPPARAARQASRLLTSGAQHVSSGAAGRQGGGAAGRRGSGAAGQGQSPAAWCRRRRTAGSAWRWGRARRTGWGSGGHRTAACCSARCRAACRAAALPQVSPKARCVTDARLAHPAHHHLTHRTQAPGRLPASYNAHLLQGAPQGRMQPPWCSQCQPHASAHVPHGSEQGFSQHPCCLCMQPIQHLALQPGQGSP